MERHKKAILQLQDELRELTINPSPDQSETINNKAQTKPITRQSNKQTKDIIDLKLK
jgi:hypothetical protein